MVFAPEWFTKLAFDGLREECERLGYEAPKSMFNACVPTYVAETDEQATEHGVKIIENADNGALNNILASASLDTNTGGTSDQLKAGLTQNIDDGNLAFMGIPVIHGSYETIARKIENIKRETGIDGMLFSWPDFVPGVRDFGEKIKPLLDP